MIFKFKLFLEFEDFKEKSFYVETFFLILDSIALDEIYSSEENLYKFYLISAIAEAVIFCRVSPSQKSDVVRIIKDNDIKAVTLAIGDGGNDVSMIMKAHIGIGVYGAEGMRAVQASDFAIGEFRFLRRLLILHGRTNLIRISEMILYFFYKNFVMTIVHFFFAFMDNSSGQTIIDDWFISSFNMIFTALPLIARAILDRDLRKEDGIFVNMLLPFLYKESRDFPVYNISAFIFTLIRGMIMGLILFATTIYSLGWGNIIDSNGNLADLWLISVSMFTSLVFV